ncbi:MAG: hypothetical protein OP8BY_1426 [Candidatus Saccharicenans subterraneus]|uniref:Uncharacterized protein n=1 Tax=Candidatus Saccharicenans subterraneus TaxID=2508984 RepID=A0A3E2BJX4_9BACT|nr:MAG: hypothetical protein OP8BY_1426 [Candidatus Saccharicenans subterraneum]
MKPGPGQGHIKNRRSKQGNPVFLPGIILEYALKTSCQQRLLMAPRIYPGQGIGQPPHLPGHEADSGFYLLHIIGAGEAGIKRGWKLILV